MPNLACLQEADRTLAEFDRHRRVTQARKAADRSRPAPGGIDSALFGFQVGGAATVGLGNQSTEGVLVGLAPVRQSRRTSFLRLPSSPRSQLLKRSIR